MIGISLVLVSPFNATTSSSPDFLGIMMSLTTTSGWLLRATSMPSSPSCATNTVNPSISKLTSSSLRITGSSSTTRTMLSGTWSMLLRGSRAEDLGSQPHLEAEPFVDGDGAGVVLRDVEHRRLAAITDPSDQIAHEGGCQTSTPRCDIRAHRADLDVSRCVHPYARHGDQCSVVVPHAEVVAELDRAPRERSGPGALDEGQHVVDVVTPQPDGIGAHAALYLRPSHLEAAETEERLPARRQTRRFCEQHRNPAGTGQGAQLLPGARRWFVGDRREHRHVRFIPDGVRGALGYRLLGTGERMPHRIVEHVHSEDPRMEGSSSRTLPHMSHWGAFRVTVDGNRIVGVAGHPDDPAPSPLLANFLDAVHHPARVARPAIRKGWLDGGPGADSRRGADD